jgi:transcription antitermination factor NusG
LPLFPGYLFVCIRPQDRVRVLQVPSLVSLIGFGAYPVPLPPEDIQALRAVLATMKAEPHPFLKIGDRVRIKSGCLAGIEGILIRKASGSRFVLNVDLIMQAASVEMSAEDVEPIASVSHASAHSDGRVKAS